MQKIAAPRGTADVYPPQIGRWQALESRMREIAHRFGYGEIRTPLFEATELFVRGVGDATDIVEKEMYSFVDKGGRNMTLRPEWTAPVVRAVLEHHLLANGPQRLYYIGPFFRYERPQAGRYRQAHQFGVECFGYAAPEADVEVIQIAHELLRAHRIDGAVLHLNSVGDAVCRPAYRAALFTHFDRHREDLSADSQRRLERNPLRILDSKADADQPMIASAPTLAESLCEPCRAHFERVQTLLKSIGITYRIDPHIVRGLDYYTRTVFEFVSPALGAQSTLCGGGRYDDLVHSLAGPPTPAVGFGLGIERFLMVLEQCERTHAAQPDGIAVIALGEAARMRLAPLVAELRRSSGPLAISIDYGDAKLALQLKRADKLGARMALIVGDEELDARTVIVRDLIHRSQESLSDTGDPVGTAAAILARYRALPPVAKAEVGAA